MRTYLIPLLLLISGCDFLANLSGENQAKSEFATLKTQHSPQLTFAVAPQIAWMPWYLGHEENIFQQSGHYQY